jgi:tetratricopeptide (TPR) repeat protein
MAIATFRAKTNFSKGMRHVKLAHNLLDQERARHLRAASRHFDTAHRLNPDDSNTLHEWGVALYELANVSEEEKAKELLLKASDKLQNALVKDVGNANGGMMNDLGAILLARAKRASGDKATSLSNDALEQFQEADRIQPGLSAYNMACIYCAQNNMDACENSLKVAKDRGFLPSAEHLAGDPDLANVQQQDWFKNLLADMQEDK